MYIASKRDTQVKRRRSWSDVSIKRRAICPSRAASKKKKEMSNELYYPARQTQRDAEERASALCVCDGSIDQQKTWRDLLYTKPRQWVSFLSFLQDGGKKKNKRSSFFSALCVRRASEENLYNGCNKPVANTNRSVTLPAIQPFTVSTKKGLPIDRETPPVAEDWNGWSGSNQSGKVVILQKFLRRRQ